MNYISLHWSDHIVNFGYFARLRQSTVPPFYVVPFYLCLLFRIDNLKTFYSIPNHCSIFPHSVFQVSNIPKTYWVYIKKMILAVFKTATTKLVSNIFTLYAHVWFYLRGHGKFFWLKSFFKLLLLLFFWKITQILMSAPVVRVWTVGHAMTMLMDTAAIADGGL